MNKRAYKLLREIIFYRRLLIGSADFFYAQNPKYATRR
nr:MAG TPA: hypothetical protein [Caudoviricetes sp.]